MKAVENYHEEGSNNYQVEWEGSLYDQEKFREVNSIKVRRNDNAVLIQKIQEFKRKFLPTYYKTFHFMLASEQMRLAGGK